MFFELQNVFKKNILANSNEKGTLACNFCFWFFVCLINFLWSEKKGYD
jgi:hypothetical protein